MVCCWAGNLGLGIRFWPYFLVFFMIALHHDDSRKHCKLEPKSGDLHDLQHQGLLHLVWARVCPAL